MRIASLQPSVTLTLSALGRLDCLCAHTRYCLEALPELSELNLPIIADSWSADTEQIVAAKPSLVMASVPYRMESLAAILRASLPVLALAPHTLADVVSDIRVIGNVVNASEKAEQLTNDFAKTVELSRSRTAGHQRPRVYCEEWGKPLIHSQTWVAELVEAAGGEFIGSPGAHTTSEAVAASDPDVMIFAWCGAGSRVPLRRVISQRGWNELSAIQQKRVFCIPDELLNTPAHTLLDGLACLGAAIHPEIFASAERMIQLGSDCVTE